jgi:lysozyme
MSNMRIDKDGVAFVGGWEGCYLYVYDDLAPRKKGVIPEWKGEPVRGTLTIGHGHTDSAKHPLKIKQGLRITQKMAREILDVDLDECEAHVNRVVTVPLTQGQFNALVSLSFNLGPLDRKAKSIIGPLNRGDYAKARAAFDLYNKSKGQVLPGLARRRDAEQAMWDKRSSMQRMLPEADEDTDHPSEVDTPQPPKTMATSVEGNAHATGGLVSAGTAAKEGYTSTLDASAAVDKVIEAREKAEALGVEANPMTMWEFVGPYVTSLAGNPIFWVSLGVGGLFLWGWVRRRRRLHEELV